MYLTQLIFSCRNRETTTMFSDCYKLHQSLSAAFAGSGRILYRIEPDETDIKKVLVQSENLCINNLALRNLCGIQTKPYSPNVISGAIFSFRLRANTITTRNGKRYSLNCEQDQIEWLNRRTINHGFSLIGTPSVSDESMSIGYKGKMFIQHKSVLFAGRLKVVDIDVFKYSLSHGIGHGKGFGFGLLSIARA